MDNELRAKFAAGLASNPYLTELLADMKRAATLAWESTSDDEKRVDCWHQVRAINQLESRIKAESQQTARGGK